jgi:hypothetical protein
MEKEGAKVCHLVWQKIFYEARTSQTVQQLFKLGWDTFEDVTMMPQRQMHEIDSITCRKRKETASDTEEHQIRALVDQPMHNLLARSNL